MQGRCNCVGNLQGAKWAVFVNMQLHLTMGRLVILGQSPGRTLIHHPSIHPENVYWTLLKTAISAEGQEQ